MSKYKYMIATTAIHKLGDISREMSDGFDGENLCVVSKEDEDNYIGNWVSGFGFVEVKFPKITTRELTAVEKQVYSQKYIQISDQPPIKLNIE